MSKIGLVIRPGLERAVELGREVLAWANSRGHEVIIEKETARGLSSDLIPVSAAQLAELADPIVVLGGDGTLIGVGRYVGKKSPILIGVNFGNLGFLTELLPEELMPILDNYFKGKITHGERGMLYVEVWRRENNTESRIFSSQAVNDIVVVKGAQDPLFDLDLFVDSEEVTRLRGDGLIVATPTGSTAYSLAAGGAIVHPALEAMLVTPICAHSLTARPLVLRWEARLEIKLPQFAGQVLVSVDGQVSVPLQPKDRVQIRRADHRVKFVRSPSSSYFEILRQKLNWGIANKA